MTVFAALMLLVVPETPRQTRPGVVNAEGDLDGVTRGGNIDSDGGFDSNGDSDSEEELAPLMREMAPLVGKSIN